MKHRTPVDGRPRPPRAAIAALAAAGIACVGAGLATQESVPTLSSTAQAAAPPGSVTAPAPRGDAVVRPPVAAPEAPSGGSSGAPSGAPSGGAPSAALPPPADVGPVLEAAEPVSLSVPSIGASSPSLVALGLTGDGALEVPADYDLAGWYRHGVTPGELGPAVIAGHVDSAAEGPAVFYRLAALQPGAEVLVERADGGTAVFVVDAVEQYPKDDFPTQRVYGDTDHAALRLITCGGDFDRGSGDYRDNIVVYAHLAGTR